MREEPYRGKIRVRACGLLIKDDALLLTQIYSPVVDEFVWTPPGGGLQFGETLNQCLQREFREETGLQVKVGKFRFLHELVEDPFHAVELYFEVQHTGGKLQLGSDPEHEPDNQILKDIRFVPLAELSHMNIAPSNLVNFLGLK